MNDSIIGTEIDGYRIHEVLGRGGMGVVYKAEDVTLSRQVALKCINQTLATDESFLRRFRSEARALAQIDSPYIVQVYTLSRLEIGLVIIMEYVEGGNLKQHVNEGGMAWTEALPLIRQMLRALEHAHSSNIIHRDIKPHNILLADAPTSHGNRVKMTDFGLAKVQRAGGQSRTVTQGVYGSLNYMSPEQVEGLGQVDHRSDIYSLGMTMYELLAGHLPFEEDGTTYRIMRTIVEDDVPRLDQFVEDVPDVLVDLVMKTLEKKPDDRFQSAAEMRAAIDDLIEQVSGSVAPLPVPSDSDSTGTGASPTDTTKVESGSLDHPKRGATDPRTTAVDTVFWGRARWLSMGIVALLVGVLVSTGYVLVRGTTNSLSLGGESKAQSTIVRPPLPSAVEPLVEVTDAAALEEQIDLRVESGQLTKGSGPEDFFIPPEECYIFVLDPHSESVEAVVDTGTVRMDLHSGTEVPDWPQMYSDRRQIWVAPTR